MTTPRTTPQGPRKSARADWLKMMDAFGAEQGSHVRLGAGHGALFTQDGETLIVTFETAASIRAGDGAKLPWGLEIAGKSGASQLCLYAETDPFFRNEKVYGFFDRLIDAGFFDAFDKVVFYGAGPCGYAAAAYSIAAPEADLVLVSPLATLDRARTEWDCRFPEMQRADFTSRYGYAPDMAESAANIWLIYDPRVSLDAMHAGLFKGPNLRPLRCRYLGTTAEQDLKSMGILGQIIGIAARGKLTTQRFYDLFRRRHRNGPYLLRILAEIKRDERPWLQGVFARAALENSGGGRLTNALAEAEEQLAAEGRSLPLRRRHEAAE
ncbi:phosphoadenosine phosphosulfate reductase [Alphaproteobacteria bacterium KMM 3653]|uniref:Phosphoadenosine phosphosulfate reductase n=1 Tax=Harenicola maris TaxID=2841044 RepID=A0AAP2CPX9_9RHOB|nr:phosphoadenosine phosphosulfate reductase [Harenicola maris]